MYAGRHLPAHAVGHLEQAAAKTVAAVGRERLADVQTDLGLRRIGCIAGRGDAAVDGVHRDPADHPAPDVTLHICTWVLRIAKVIPLTIIVSRARVEIPVTILPAVEIPVRQVALEESLAVVARRDAVRVVEIDEAVHVVVDAVLTLEG